MRTKAALFVLASSAVAVPGVARAQSVNLLSPSDFIIGIDNNRNVPGNTNTGAEGPATAFDGADALKWYSGGRAFAGLIRKLPSGPAVVQSVQFTSANDSSDRDPVAFQLFGRNGTISTVNNGTGLEDAWTFVGNGATGLADRTSPATLRNTPVAPVSITNTTAYENYKVVFTKLRSTGDAVSPVPTGLPSGVQLAEARLFTGPNGTGSNVSEYQSEPPNPDTTTIAFDQTDSAFPTGEPPRSLIDGNKASGKYLNFGKEGSGVIITPARGSSIVNSLRLTTANDSPDRDPARLQLFGTNAPITSLEDSEGASEAWTLLTNTAVTLPAARLTDGDLITFANTSAYTSYKLIFSEVKNTGTNAMQIGEVQFFNTPLPEPASAGLAIVAIGGLLGGRRRRR